VSEERVFDEQTGFQTVATYEGFKAAVDSALGLLSNIRGLRMNSRQDNGPWYRMTVSYAGTVEGTDEPPVDTWSRIVEFAQEDIRNNPNVIKLVTAAAGVGATTAQIANKMFAWFKDIQDARKADPPALPEPHDIGEDLVYELYSRGAEAHEQKRIVVRRRRIIPVSFAQPATIRAVEIVYTTEQLIAAFGVPLEFQPLLPPNPPFLPSNAMWGWRERSNTTDFVGSINKTEETMEWVFAAWSTVLYDPA
jgi:hypothetical protein